VAFFAVLLRWLWRHKHVEGRVEQFMRKVVERWDQKLAMATGEDIGKASKMENSETPVTEMQTVPLENISVQAAVTEVTQLEDEGAQPEQQASESRDRPGSPALPPPVTAMKRKRSRRGKKNRVRILETDDEGDDDGKKETDEKAEVLEGDETHVPMPGDEPASSGSTNSAIARVSTQGAASLRSITVSDVVLGYGSHGTVVYKGTFEGREVAIKRLLLDFYAMADHEVQILQESDYHPNVVRYYFKENCDGFMYIALELCPASLSDVIEKTTSEVCNNLRVQLRPMQVLFQMMLGIHHLHSLKIVH